MKVTETAGRRAEAAAAHFLAGKGCTIDAQNWRCREAEIDIIAHRGGTLYFFEVKYRRTNTYGDGLDFITNQKLRQMRRAVSFWLSENRWPGAIRLGAIEVSGPEFAVTACVTDL